MNLKIESRKMITPSVPTPKTKLKLSFMDQIQFPVYVGIIFYYKDNNSLDDIPERLAKLEKSLSETLVLYYPFAGRFLVEGGCSFIDCGDRGVEYIVAKVDCQIDLLLDNHVDPDMLSNLSSFPTESEDGNSLIVIQANVFKCGGLAIGVRFYHKLADTCTLSMFMSAWSKACHGGITQVIPPSFDLGSLFPQKEIGETRPPSGFISEKLVSHNFTFHNDVISKLKAEMTKKSNESHPETPPFQASRVEVVSAVISTAIIEIKSAKHGVNSKPFVLYHTMNLRGRTNLRIPENSCGNFFTRIVTPPRKVEQTGIITTLSMLGMICDAIRKAKLEFFMATDVDLYALVEKKYKESAVALRKTVEGEINLIAFSSWSKFPLYEVDFGWGKPDFVSSTTTPIEFSVLIDSKSNDGIVAWVTLGMDDMLLLKHKLRPSLQF